MTDHDLDIPAFLRRTDTPRPQDAGTGPGWHMPARPAGLSAAARDRLAGSVIAAVERGADTFGKLRKALGDRHSDAQLRAGIRAARHWRIRVQPVGTRRQPQLRTGKVRLEVTGRRYSIVEG